MQEGDASVSAAALARKGLSVRRKPPGKAEHEWGWERIARYCVPASVTAIGGPRARHAVLPRGTSNSDDIFRNRIPAPHQLTRKKNNVYDSTSVAFCDCTYHNFTV